MTVCPYECDNCITKCADRNIDKDFDISEYFEYLSIGCLTELDFDEVADDVCEEQDDN